MNVWRLMLVLPPADVASCRWRGRT